MNIANINESDNTFDLELDFIGGWQDPRLAFDAGIEGLDRRVYLGPGLRRDEIVRPVLRRDQPALRP